MIQALIPGALAFTMLSSQISPAPLLSSHDASGSTQQKLIWIVREDNSLRAIAKTYYGDVKFWTTLWNDNPDVSDPTHVTNGTLLTLRPTPPEAEEELSDTIKTRYPEFTEDTKPEPVTVVIPEIQAASVSAHIVPTISPTTPPPPPADTPHTLTDAQVTFLGNCEAGMVANRNSGNGYYGAFQFSYGTWKSMGTPYERADLAPIEVQKDAVQRLIARSSIYNQFPACSRAMQAAGLL